MKENDTKELIGQLFEAWTAQSEQERATLPTRLALGKVHTVPSLYQGRGNTNGSKFGDIQIEIAQELCAKLAEDPTKDLQPVTVLYLPKAKSRKYVLIAGHHRLWAYQAAGRREIPVTYAACDPFEAIGLSNAENLHTHAAFTEINAADLAYVKLVQVAQGLVHPTTGEPWTHKEIAKDSGAAFDTVKKLSAAITKWRKGHPDEEFPETRSEFSRDQKGEDPEYAAKMLAKWTTILRTKLPRMRSEKSHSRLMEAVLAAYPSGFEQFYAVMRDATVGRLYDDAYDEIADNIRPELQAELEKTVGAALKRAQRQPAHSDAWDAGFSSGETEDQGHWMDAYDSPVEDTYAKAWDALEAEGSAKQRQREIEREVALETEPAF